MTKELQTNRYGTQVPSVITDNGVTISTPIYFRITPDQAKLVLNKFREKKRTEFLEMGVDTSDQPVVGTSLSVKTAMNQLSPIEVALGQNEESLRLHLFNRQGINERLLVKLQELLDFEIVSSKDLLEASEAWISHLFDYEKQRTQRTNTPGKVTKPRTRKTTATK